MSGYKLPGLKLLNRIYKTENRINGGLGVLFFYNNFLANNKKGDIPSNTIKNTDVVISSFNSNGNKFHVLFDDRNADGYSDLIIQ